MTSTVTTPIDPWAGVAEVADVQAALDKLRRLQAELPAHPAVRPATLTRPALSVEVAETLSAGRPLPPDLGRRAAAAETPQDEVGALGRLLGEARQHLQHLLEQARRRHADQALGYLDARLHDLLDRVSVVDGILGPVIADPAGRWPDRTDLASAWEQLGYLVDEYQQIRAAQAAVVGMHTSADGRISLLAYLRQSGRVGNSASFNPLREYLATGEAAEADAPDEDIDPYGYVRWLARPEVQAWVPTVAELKAEHQAQAEAVAAADLEQARARGQAVDVANRYQPRVVRVVA